MSNYIKNQLAGATYFFTLTLAQRNAGLLTDNIDLLRLVVHGLVSQVKDWPHSTLHKHVAQRLVD